MHRRGKSFHFFLPATAIAKQQMHGNKQQIRRKINPITTAVIIK